MTGDSDRRSLLYDSVTSGDARALDSLIVDYLPRLRAFVRARMDVALRRRESCSDLVQSVCRDLLAREDKFEFEGEAQFREAVRLSPEGTEPHYRGLYNLGVGLGTRGRFDEAQTFVERALAQQPEFFDALRYLGYLAQQRGRLALAIEHYENALELEPAEPLTIFYLGTAQLAAGDVASARRQLSALQAAGHPAARELRGMLDGR